jgi:hypothetical protein
MEDHKPLRLREHALARPANAELSATSGLQPRHWALALLFVAYVLNFFDRQIINVLAQDIKTELQISDTQLGLLTGTDCVWHILFAVWDSGRLAC